MSTKMSRTNKNIKINICLFIVAAIIFATMAVCGVGRIQIYANLLPSLSNAPSVCAETSQSGDNTTYICDTSGSEVVESGDQALLIYDRTNFDAKVISYELMIAVVLVGSIATAASLLGAVIYWIHNRQ